MEWAPKAGDEYEVKSAYHMAHEHRKKLQGVLNIARVNKQINREATDIFYGENQFRFTNSLGWYVLHSFLTMIGHKNAARLGHLTVCVPWRGHDEDVDSWDSSVVHGTDSGARQRPAAIRKVDLPIKATAPLRFEQARLACIQILQQCVDLRVLRIALPHTCRFEDVPSLPRRYWLSRGQVTGLAVKTQLVHLARSDQDDEKDSRDWEICHVDEKSEKEYTSQQLAARFGWGFVMARDDWYGRYKVAEDA